MVEQIQCLQYDFCLWQECYTRILQYGIDFRDWDVGSCCQTQTVTELNHHLVPCRISRITRRISARFVPFDRDSMTDAPGASAAGITGATQDPARNTVAPNRTYPWTGENLPAELVKTKM